MSRESRTIRPFAAGEEFARFFEQSILHFGKNSCLPEGTEVVEIPPHEFLVRSIALSLSPDDASFDQLRDDLREASNAGGLPLDALALLVVGRSSFLSTTEVVARFPLGDLSGVPRVIDLVSGGRAGVFRRPFEGFIVEAFLYLDRPLEPRPLRPHLRGTWLAKARYEIATKHGRPVFSISPLTEEVRARLRLPAKTVKYIDFGDHDLLEPIRISEPPIYYVDEEVLAQLTARKAAPASRTFQAQLALDFVAAVVWRASTRDSELEGLTFDDVKDSLLGHVVRLAVGSGSGAAERERMLDMVRTSPERVIAYAEDAIGVSENLAKALQDGEE